MTALPAEVPVQLERKRNDRVERPADSNLIIGKDIVELLSTAMYVDPLTIFREYVQNAADAIDEANARGIGAEGNGRIAIDLDGGARDIRIRDNGVGVRATEAENVLTAFGASGKRGKSARGFRGVGRLAALGYAQYVTFRTKTIGDTHIAEVRWDCRKLKRVLLDHSYKGHLGQVVSDVVTVALTPATDTNEHFFEVHLEKVTRIKNDVLLNEVEVRKYLAQVAPLPFPEEFAWRAEVEAHVRPHIAAPRFGIHVNGQEPSLTRPFRDEFEVTKGKLDRVLGVRLVELRDSEGGARAVGWLLEHSDLGAIQSSPELRGLRARVGDIQIGGEDVFDSVFPEPRFNGWTIGEIHILDPRIVPNGRRDAFEQNAAYTQLLGELIPIGRDVARRCRASSAKRNRLKGFDLRAKRIEELLKALKRRLFKKSAAAAARRQIGALLGDMQKALDGQLLLESDKRIMARRLARLRKRVEVARPAEHTFDPLRALAPKKRPIYEEVIGLIYECSVNRKVADALVNRITARLSTLR